MLKRIFIDHPRSAGESYSEHMREALSFSFAMLGAGLACFVHAFVPALFMKTGSSEIERLHARMVANRRRKPILEIDARALRHE